MSGRSGSKISDLAADSGSEIRRISRERPLAYLVAVIVGSGLLGGGGMSVVSAARDDAGASAAVAAVEDLRRDIRTLSGSFNEMRLTLHTLEIARGNAGDDLGELKTELVELRREVRMLSDRMAKQEARR